MLLPFQACACPIECDLKRGGETAGIGDAFPGDFKRGAVIHACADDRQSERRVYAAIKRKHFEWNVSLIVIHRNDSVETVQSAFDEKCAHAVLQLKHKYPHIKLIRILTYYHHDKEKYDLPSCYDGSILPEIEELHYKQKITKRNEWIIDHCDILVCHIEETYKSGAYLTLKYAQKQNKPIIYI